MSEQSFERTLGLKLTRITELLSEIDCCYGHAIPSSDYPKFWEAQELAREVEAIGTAYAALKLTTEGEGK